MSLAQSEFEVVADAVPVAEGEVLSMLLVAGSAENDGPARATQTAVAEVNRIVRII
jgi:hypothetical protein